MVSKNQIKHITSLHQKKYRQQAQLFIAEGKKVIEELLNSNYELEPVSYTHLDVYKRQVYVIRNIVCLKQIGTIIFKMGGNTSSFVV